MKLLGLLAGAVVVVGVALWAADVDAPPPAVRAEPVVTAPTYRWPPGLEWRYALQTSTQSTIELLDTAPSSALEVRLELAGEVRLRSYGGGDATTRLGLRFAELTAHELTVGGEQTLANAAPLEDHEGYLDVTPQGEVRALRFAPAAPPVFRSMVQLVVGEMQARLEDGSAWRAVEITQHGEAPTDYVAARGGGIHTLHKRRDEYTRLTGLSRGAERRSVAYVAEVEIDGVLRRLEAREHVRAFDGGGRTLLDSRSRTRLRLLGARPFEAAPPSEAELVAYRPGQPAFDAELARRQHARQRVAGLTPDALLNTLAEHGPSGTLPDHNRFLWRATGLLREHPELCSTLVDLFERPEMTHRGRALLLDLLVGAGTPEAQMALRRALATTTAAGDAGYKRLYQRLSLIEAPTGETIALLQGRYSEPGQEGPRAATYALGSGAGHLHRRGDVQRAAEIGERLREDLEAAEESFAVVSLLGALGNAGLPGHAPDIIRHRGDGRPEVRHAVAAALRKLDDSRAGDALVEMTTDGADRVSRRAVRSLMRRELGATQIGRLRALVAARAVDVQCYPEMVSLVAPYLGRHAGAEAILRLILDQKTRNPRLEGRIRALLGV